MWVLFDLNGTLLDPAVLLDPPELPIAALDEANMMAMITVIAGAETTFKPLFDAALRRQLERAGRDPDEAAGALEKLARDAGLSRRCPGALEALRTAAPARGAHAVGGRAGRGGARATPASASTSSTCSPPPLQRVQARGPRLPLRRSRQLGATEAWFVAGHWWDIAGAAYAGLKTAWVSRTDLAYPVAMPEPDVRGADIAEVAEAIVRPA